MLPSSREIGLITPSNFDQTSQDDFIEQMLSHLSPWTDLSGNQNPKPIWDQNPNASNNQKLFSLSLISDDPSHCNQNQITQQVLIQRSLPLTLGSHDSSDRSHEDGKGGNFIQDNMHNSLSGSVIQSIPTNYQQHFQSSQPGSIPPQNFGASATASNTAPVKQKVRARRGQATDPHSIAERLRRERIAERMKALQELLPNASKTDKATMLDEIIDYVKFLQLQVKVLSMSRLGGAAAVVPLVTDISSLEGAGGVDCIQSSNGAQIASDDNLTVTEEQVAKLMEEDMGSAMQYLQGKGLCLMPISLASAISTAAGHHRNPNGDAPSSPSISVLTVQSALGPTGETDVTRPSMKDAISVSKP